MVIAKYHSLFYYLTEHELQIHSKPPWFDVGNWAKNNTVNLITPTILWYTSINIIKNSDNKRPSYHCSEDNESKLWNNAWHDATWYDYHMSWTQPTAYGRWNSRWHTLDSHAASIMTRHMYKGYFSNRRIRFELST